MLSQTYANVVNGHSIALIALAANESVKRGARGSNVVLAHLSAARNSADCAETARGESILFHARRAS